MRLILELILYFLNECYRDGDRSSFIPNNREIIDNLEIVGEVQKEENLNPNGDDSFEVGNNNDIESAMAEMTRKIVENKQTLTVHLVRRGLKWKINLIR